MEENWKDIVGYNGTYKVSNKGIIISKDRYVKGKHNSLQFKKGKIIKPYITNGGYLKITFKKNGISTKHFVHRLVAKAFIPNPNNLEEVNHINGIKTDNRVENLEWVSHLGNMQHARKNGLFKNIFKKKITQIKNGIIINTFESIIDAERITGINSSHISSACKGKRKTCGGYEWKYQ